MKKAWLFNSILFTASFSMISAAQAVSKTDKVSPAMPMLADPGPAPTTDGLQWIEAKDFDKLKAEALKRSKRNIASVEQDLESALSPEYKAFRDRFLALKTAAEVQPLLEELDRNYDKYPNDLKLAAALLVPLKAWRGVVYRMVPLAEKSRVVHSELLSRVKRLAGSLQMHLPTDQWKAGFAYITEPYDRVYAFKSADDLQTYFAGTLYPAMRQSAQRLEDLLPAANTPIIWDNKILYGTGSFPDSLDRYRTVDRGAIELLLSGRHAGMSLVAILRAYTLDGSIDTTSDVGKLYGFDGFASRQISGVSAADVVGTIRKKPGLFLLFRDGKAWMQIAFKNYQESVRRLSLAWAELKGRDGDVKNWVNPELANSFSRQLDNTLPALEAAIAGPALFRSRITGETVKVDLPGFFANPPADLKAMMPTEFEGGSDLLYKTVEVHPGAKPEKLAYRNYLKGRATSWNADLYRRFFPDLKSGTDVATLSRILDQSWGGRAAMLPIAPYIP